LSASDLDTVRARFEHLPKADIKPLLGRPEQHRKFDKPRKRRLKAEAAQ
jgi:hypothetical protein